MHALPSNNIHLYACLYIKERARQSRTRDLKEEQNESAQIKEENVFG